MQTPNKFYSGRFSELGIRGPTLHQQADYNPGWMRRVNTISVLCMPYPPIVEAAQEH